MNNESIVNNSRFGAKPYSAVMFGRMAGFFFLTPIERGGDQALAAAAHRSSARASCVSLTRCFASS
jgi:hypothetical protein